METCVLENDQLRVSVRAKSAELTSIVKKSTGKEYLWNADKEYWGWSSPILFPNVGGCKDNTYRWEGKSYEIPRHGFARNMEFTLESATQTECWWKLTDSEETRKVFPFAFVLEIGYRLENKRVLIMWKVTNPDTEELHFSIGAHPALMWQLEDGQQVTDCWISMDLNSPFPHFKKIDPEDGMVLPTDYDYELEDGNMHRITADEFKEDALIFEDSQVKTVYLSVAEQRPFAAVNFPKAPAVGIWAPYKEGVPFVCIEPWYGRSEDSGFDGDWSERPLTNHLKAGEVFETSYSIDVY